MTYPAGPHRILWKGHISKKEKSRWSRKKTRNERNYEALQEARSAQRRWALYCTQKILNGMIGARVRETTHAPMSRAARRALVSLSLSSDARKASISCLVRPSSAVLYSSDASAIFVPQNCCSNDLCKDSYWTFTLRAGGMWWVYGEVHFNLAQMLCIEIEHHGLALLIRSPNQVAALRQIIRRS